MASSVIGTFLTRCSRSSQEAYDAFKQLLSQIEGPSSRGAALKEWITLADSLCGKETLKTHHFSISELQLKPQEGPELKLRLLQLPSTFAPEEWSFTFFEGLTRYKAAEFVDRRIVELGCGNGWITLALALQSRPSKIWGLDINPRAITCSRLNLYLNAFHADGSPRWTSEGRTLEDLVEFHASDLLSHARSLNLLIDRIIGCIPQVLNPDPEFTTKLLSEGVQEASSDEFLYSLSNYATSGSGSIEDQFGLGLIARALEESVDVLRPSGKIILNLGGRPGTNVLRQLFLRRGFNVRRVWHTQVTQAKDTDIQALVQIEKKTRHRFEFYMGRDSDIPVSASTAYAYAQAGGEIAHGLSVYEARLRDPIHTRRIIRHLRESGEDVRNAIDLSYSDDSLAEEKMSFLSSLAEMLEDSPTFPYEETAGVARFRQGISGFFRNYFRIPWGTEHVAILPSLVSACELLLRLHRPRQALIDSHLATALHGREGVLEVPRRADLACELLQKLRPELMIYTIPAEEGRTRDAWDRITSTAAETGTRVFFDISELLELSSTPPSSGVFSAWAEEPLPNHVALICGLVKNRLYRDLEACFVITENQTLLDHLIHGLELTWSRTPLFSQLYYERILSDLLNFQLSDARRGGAAQLRALLPESTGRSRPRLIGLAEGPLRAFDHPAIRGEAIAHSATDEIRLDYGENSLPAPRLVGESLFEAFSRMHLTAAETDPAPEVLRLIQDRLAISGLEPMHVSIACGIAPLFSAIAEHCARRGITLVFPAGSYGHFVASAQFHGARVQIVATREEDRFKLTPKALGEALSGIEGHAWLMLNAPLVNPTGALYTSDELEGLLEVAHAGRAPVILDTVFSGLEFSASRTSTPLSLKPGQAPRLAILGGLSKELASGGLRLGFGASSDPELHAVLRAGSHPEPHSTLRFAMKKILSRLVARDPALIAELGEQRRVLRQRAETLTRALASRRWKVLPSEGGLFLVARPEPGIDANLPGVLVNPPEWTGIPGYTRLVLSVAEKDFDEAIRRITVPAPTS